MDRLLAKLVAHSSLVFGCSSSAPKRLVGGDAVLSAVSSDQKWVAVLTRHDAARHRRAPRAARGGADVGRAADAARRALVGRPLQSRHDAVVSRRRQRRVARARRRRTHVYGALYVWSPALPAPVKVGNNVREYYPSQNGETCVFIDWATPTIDAANTGTLVAVHAPSCGGGGVQPARARRDVTLGADGVAHRRRRRARAGDGARRERGRRRQGVAGDDVDGRRCSSLSTGVNPRSAMMTPAGDTRRLGRRRQRDPRHAVGGRRADGDHADGAARSTRRR